MPEEVGLEQGHGCDYTRLPACGISVQVQGRGHHAWANTGISEPQETQAEDLITHKMAGQTAACLPVTFSVSAAVPAPQQ